jgi:hypothetical protein
MHNEMLCYHHRRDYILPVLENDPFLLDKLDDTASVQQALTNVLSRLACNHMDLKRAALMLQGIQIAASRLAAQERIAAAAARQAAAQARAETAAAAAQNPVIPSEKHRSESKDLRDRPSGPTPLKSFSDYPDDEQLFLRHTFLLGRDDHSFPRPPTLSVHEAEAIVNAHRIAEGWKPIKFTKLDPPATPANEEDAVLPGEQPRSESKDPDAPRDTATDSGAPCLALRHGMDRH